jgi:hypothetical protein
MTWTQAEAIELCTKIEAVAPKFGCHVALTGGLLYKQGPRKDADIMLYRIRQTSSIDMGGLWEALEDLGVVVTDDNVPYGHSWCIKAQYLGRLNIDFFFPEAPAEEVAAELDPTALELL